MVFKAHLNQREIKKLARDYKKTLERAGYPVERIVLFGSYTKGHEHDWSDVDLLVVSKKFETHDTFDERVKISVIASGISPLIEAHAASPKEFKKPESPWIIEAKRYGKQLI